MTRPSASLNWYEPGASGIVPAGGRCTTPDGRPVAVHWPSRRTGDIPAGRHPLERPGCPTVQHDPPGRSATCSAAARSRAYAASPEELAERIAAAKAALGDRVFILGHHYQRDEVMRWADARGDSFRLSVLAKEQPGGRLHRLLRRPLHGRVGRRPDRRPPAGHPARPQRRVLDGRHGRHRLGRGGVGGAGRTIIDI